MNGSIKRIPVRLAVIVAAVCAVMVVEVRAADADTFLHGLQFGMSEADAAKTLKASGIDLVDIATYKKKTGDRSFDRPYVLDAVESWGGGYLRHFDPPQILGAEVEGECFFNRETGLVTVKLRFDETTQFARLLEAHLRRRYSCTIRTDLDKVFEGDLGGYEMWCELPNAALQLEVLPREEKTNPPAVILINFRAPTAKSTIAASPKSSESAPAASNGHAKEVLDLPTLARRTRPAVVLVQTFDPAGKSIGSGSGFFISQDGKLVTNFHVVDGAARVVVKSESGEKYDVEGVLAEDGDRDLVILQATASGVATLTLGDSTTLEPGVRIAVIGSPLGLEGTLSEGILAAQRGRSENVRTLQISAPISPGSSGSPVLDAGGRVIGIASGALTKGQALNLAVPVEAAKSLLSRAAAQPKAFLSDAAPEADRALSDPDRIAAWAAIEAERFPEALKLLNLLLPRYPQVRSDLLLHRGYVFRRLGFVKEAVADLKKSIALRPDEVVTWIELCRAFGALERYREAEKAGAVAVKLAPNSATAWAVYGGSKFKPDDPLAGLEDIKRSLKINPDQPQLWKSVGLRYKWAGMPKEAADANRRARELEQKAANEVPKPSGTSVRPKQESVASQPRGKKD